MNRLVKIGLNTLISGGIINNGGIEGYISDAMRRTLGLGLAHFQDGTVRYFGKNVNRLERGLIQRAHQLAYGLLRSYPRYLRYWEQRERDKHIMENSQTSIANKEGQFFQLISEQEAVSRIKSYTDSIVGNTVADYLECKIAEEGSYYDQNTGKIEPNTKFGLVTFVDLQPVVQVSSKKNVVMTTVQGRDYTRKELISGGDLEISISGRITSKYPDVYPEAEVAKFLRLAQYKGVIDCENTILRQFKITRFIILNYTLNAPACRNIQPYTLTCVAIEPSEAVELKSAEQEKVDTAIKHTNKWLKWTRFGTEVIDPASLLKISKLWI